MSSLGIGTNVILRLDNMLLLNSSSAVFPCGLLSNPDKKDNMEKHTKVFISVWV